MQTSAADIVSSTGGADNTDTSRHVSELKPDDKKEPSVCSLDEQPASSKKSALASPTGNSAANEADAAEVAQVPSSPLQVRPVPPPPPLSPSCDQDRTEVTAAGGGGEPKTGPNPPKKPLVSLQPIAAPATALDGETIDIDDFKQRRNQLASKLHLPGMTKQP